MILSEREIQMLVALKLLIVDPLPAPDSPLWASTALDLTLDKTIRRWTACERLPTGQAGDEIFPGLPGFNVQEMLEDPTRATPIDLEREHFFLAPREFVLAFTKETV